MIGAIAEIARERFAPAPKLARGGPATPAVVRHRYADERRQSFHAFRRWVRRVVRRARAEDIRFIASPAINRAIEEKRAARGEILIIVRRRDIEHAAFLLPARLRGRAAVIGPAVVVVTA